jgi:hypothetical protein
MTQKLAGQTTGLNTDRASGLCVKTGLLSVLHYFSMIHHPILKAFNMCLTTCSHFPTFTLHIIRCWLAEVAN